MTLTPPRPRRLRFWNRQIHLYLGLFFSPFLVVFALSAIAFNHGFQVVRPVMTTRQAAVTIPAGLQGLDLARDILRQTGLSGEIDYFQEQQPHLRFPLSRPTRKMTVDVDLAAGTATIQERQARWYEALMYVHKMPGPHNVGFRGNWVFTRWWGYLADGTVYGLLLITLTGVVLWLTAKTGRKAGWMCCTAGLVSFVVLVLALLW